MTKKIEKKFNRGDKVQSRRGVDDSFDGIGYIVCPVSPGQYLCYFPDTKKKDLHNIEWYDIKTRLPDEKEKRRWYVYSKALTLIKSAPQPKELKKKITVKTPAPKTVKKTYPYFGKYSSGQVVLFFEPKTGISVDKLPGVFKKDWNETSAKVLEHFEATFSV
jgi:hypothetical protein